MGGMRGAGDLVARMQMTRGLKIREAKAYVADRLKVSEADLTDPVVMDEVRKDLQIGTIRPLQGYAKSIEAKFNIAELLGIDINYISRFKDKISIF